MVWIFLLVVFAITDGLSSLHTGHQRLQHLRPIPLSPKPVEYSTTRLKASPRFIFHILKHKFKYPLVEKIPTQEPTANCICVPYYQCNTNNTIITDGAGIIDVRFITVTFRRCTGDLEVCCRLPPASMAPIVTPTAPPTTMMTTTTTTTTPAPTTTTPTTTTTRMTTTTTTTTTPAPTTTTTTTTTTPPPTTPTTTTTTTTTTVAPITAPPYLCICVPVVQCDATGFIIVSGEGIINPRQTLNPCPIVGQICCRLAPTTQAPPALPPPTPQQPIVTASPPIIVQPINCVCVQLYQCDANGYVLISGAGAIDPRFPIGRQGQVAGTCVSLTQVCCRISANAQEPAIGFPAVDTTAIAASGGTIKNPGTPQACVCVKSWQCSEGNAVSLDGAGIIDPRFGACPSADEICCRLQGITRNLASAAAASSVAVGGVGNAVIINTNAASASKGSAATAICGIRATNCLSAEACASKPGETSFAEFPWMVALLIRKPGDNSLLFQCGASVINTRTILTAAHCVVDRPAGVLVARFGEWNTANNDEPAPFQEADVQTVVTHPLYYNGGLYNDVAVLILKTPVTYAINVMPICLPQQGMVFAPGTSCWASGWGRSAFQGQYQTILKKVDLPIVDRSDCQTRLRATRLGQYFQLHGSFICAGGESSKDTCRGDGGGPLVCPTATGQFVQAGIVSWGIGCGESNTPAVYASVSQFRQWIDQQLANYGVL